MQNSPLIQDPNAPPGLGFDPKRLLLGDIDGDGLADLVYIEARRTTIWINQGGNKYSDPLTIENTPLVSDPDAVRIVDLLGTGTSGILWSAKQSGSGSDHYQYLDLARGI